MENIIYEICAILAVVVFIVIAFFLVKTLKALQESLKLMNASLTKIETQIEPVSNQTVRLLENTNEIAESFQDKISNLDPLLESISNVGCALQKATSSFSNEEKTLKFFHLEKKSDWQEIASDFIQLATLGVVTWQKIKKGR